LPLENEDVMEIVGTILYCHWKTSM